MIKLLCILLSINFIFAAETESVSVQDGLETTISDAEFEELKLWANNTKKDLDFLKSRVDVIKKSDDRLDLYARELSVIVQADVGLNALNMRKLLNRAVNLDEIVDKNSRGRKTRAFRELLYKHFVSLAMGHHQTDIQFIEQKTKNDGGFLISSHESLKYLLNLSNQRATKISDDARRELKVQYVRFMNRDLFESSYRQATAFEVGKIRRIMTDGAREGEEILLLQLLDSAINIVSSDIEAKAQAVEAQRQAQLAEQQRQAQAAEAQRQAQLAEQQRQAQATAEAERQSRVNNTQTRSEARSALEQEELRIYSNMLTNSSWVARRDAVNQLARIKGEGVTEILINSLLDSDSDVKNATYSALSSREFTASNRDELYKVYKKSRSWIARRMVVYLLTSLRDDHVATTYLIRAIKDSDSDVSSAAYTGVGKSRVLGEYHLSELQDVLSSNSWTKRRLGVYLLGRIKTVESFRILGDLLSREKDSDVLNAIRNAMTNIRNELN